MIATLVAMAALSCGTERWPAKTLTDPQSKTIDLSRERDVTIDELRELKANPWDNNAPRAGDELQVVRVIGDMVGAKLEADEDIHIVLADKVDKTHTIIMEIPSAHCLEGTDPKVAARILEARKDFLKLMRVSATFKKFKYPPTTAVTGVIFYDKRHGQTGVAPNGAELHPILDLVVAK